MLKKKHNLGVLVEKNAFTDEGNGVIRFPNKLVITDDSVQKNGTRYDMPTYDTSSFKGHLTVDHADTIGSIIGNVLGTAKIGNRVVVDGIQFAVKENAVAKLAYDLLRGGYATDFSTETFGPPPDESGVYFNSKLVGLSMVVVGNNDNATVNQLVANSIEESEKNGLDVSGLEEYLPKFAVSQNHADDKTESKMNFVTIKNGRKFAIKLRYKNAAGEEVETTVAPGESLDVSEDQKKEVEAQVEQAEEPKAPEADEAKGEESKNAFIAELNKVVAPLKEKIELIEKNQFDTGFKEPQFVPAKNSTSTLVTTGVKSQLSELGWQELAGLQINTAWDALKGGSTEAMRKLQTINEFNLEGLKAAKKVKNAMTIADFGNFVISPEQLTEIEGFRSNYTALINATSWRETLSTQMAWLKRDGDINMQPVEFCDDDADGNLKPVSEYDANILTANLEELAAVTPVCNAATRFLAADMIGDINEGYRNDYDRKRAQLIIARLEQAVEANGNSAVYRTDTDTHSLQSWLETMGFVSEVAQNGTYIFNYATYVQLVSRILGAGVTGPMSQIFTTGEQAQILGHPYIVVPNDLMPTLNTAQTKTFVVNGVTVTVNHAVYYADLSKFSGRTSGGLQYDLSTDAAYEIGDSVRSAFQRNELVLRGSFFRGGAIRDTAMVAGLRSNGVS